MASLNNLFLKCVDKLKDLQSKNPFKTITIVVPSIKTEKWFKTMYLKTYDNVLMNVKFKTLNNYLLSLLDNNYYQLTSQNDIKTFLIKFFLSNPDAKISNDIIESYLSNKNKSMKTYDVCTLLAELYISYDEDDLLENYIDKGKYLIFKKIENDLLENNLISLTYIKNHVKKIDDDNIYFFGFSKLSIIEKIIIDKLLDENKNERFFEIKKEDSSIKINDYISAPSMYREIENLHSKICKILLNDTEHKLNFSDFLVLAPNISQYKSTIASIFKQDNESYVDLPYCICYRDENSNLLYQALEILFKIFKNLSFTRDDFISLCENKLIQKVRNIDKKDIEAIKKIILNSNTYRNKDDNSYDDWELLKRRLILSKILLKKDDCSDTLNIGETEYAPFTYIDLDDERIAKIIKLIDDLKEVISLNSVKSYFDYNNLISLFDKFFSIKENEVETNTQYNKLINEITNYKNLNINLNVENIDILFYSLLDIANSNKFVNGELFTKGITFLDLDYSSLLEAKYLFIIGCDSKSLNFNYIKREIDDRDEESFKAKVKEEKESFKLQASLCDELYISYVNQDLTTDEEYFPSPIIKEITNKKPTEMSLDENRDYDQLFTRRETENKKYYKSLIEDK